MNREDVIRIAKDSGWATRGDDLYPPLERFAALVAAEKEQQMIRDGYRQCAKGQRTTQFCGLLDAAVKAEREKVAAWMRSKSYATGHGDTIEDLLKELEWQVAEREREALGDIILDYAERDDLSDSDESLLKHLFELIRARGEV